MCVRFDGLPDHVKRCKNIGRFRKDAKYMLIKLESYSLEDYLNLENSN